MTVAKLIKLLQKFNQEADVVVPGRDHSFRRNIAVYLDEDIDRANAPVVVIE